MAGERDQINRLDWWTAGALDRFRIVHVYYKYFAMRSTIAAGNATLVSGSLRRKKILDTVTPVAVCYIRNTAMANSLHLLLTRREREIMDAVFALGNRASAEQIRGRLTDPPT